MTEKFNNYVIFIESLLLEAKKCTGPSLRQLSDKPEYRWMACMSNPYSPGYKRVYWSRKGEKVNVAKCLKNKPRFGTMKGMACRDAVSAARRRLRKRRNRKD